MGLGIEFQGFASGSTYVGHGGAVTDAQLIERARTGLTPDGVKSFIPSISTAFNSDSLLRFADQTIRDSAAFQAAINAAGTNEKITISSGDLGVDLGRGYEAVGGTYLARNTPGRLGPIRRVDNLRSATATYVRNPSTGQWETITIYPGKGP